MKEPLDDQHEILYEINAGAPGILYGKNAPVGEFLDAAKLTKPNNAKFCYHKSSQQPDSSWEVVKDTLFKRYVNQFS